MFQPEGNSFWKSPVIVEFVKAKNEQINKTQRTCQQVCLYLSWKSQSLRCSQTQPQARHPAELHQLLRGWRKYLLEFWSSDRLGVLTLQQAADSPTQGGIILNLWRLLAELFWNFSQNSHRQAISQTCWVGIFRWKPEHVYWWVKKKKAELMHAYN